MEDTSGFYKLENEQLLYAYNGIIGCDFSIHRPERNTYEYPIDGWYWFDSEALAKEFFNIVDEPVQEENLIPPFFIPSV